jgi:hypothetical protein
MIILELRSPASSDQVLSALRSHAGGWRESRLPAELRRLGIRSVECEVRGATCLLRYDRRWYGAFARGQYLQLRATVATDGPGTRVGVVVLYRWRNVALSVSGLLVSSLAAVAVMGLHGLRWPLVACGAAALHYRWLRERTRRLESHSDALVDYLVQRVKLAVEAAARAEHAAHAS